MAFLGTVLRIIGILPGIIIGVENLFGAKKGGDKKDAVLALLKVLFGGVQAVAPGVVLNGHKIMDGVGKIIDGLVDVFNGAGVFQKS